MAHWKQNFDYKFTGAYELKEGETKTLTIQKTGKEKVKAQDGTEQMCFVAYFSENSKPMVLNKTNCKTIEKLYGSDSDSWNGKKIIVEAKKVKAFGEFVDALRVKQQKPQSQSLQSIDAKRTLLENSKTLEELQQNYVSLTAPEKAELLKLKDELKIKLQTPTLL